MQLKTLRTHTLERGFSLVEVMVAVIVICVGLLGIAKMQALALSNTTTARLRSLAAIEAASLAAAMHSNRLYWATTPPQTITVTTNSGAGTTTVVSTDGVGAQASADLGALTWPTPAVGTGCVGSNNGNPACPVALNLAAHDLALWSQSVAALLPNPASTIACVFNPGANIPPSCTIQITWQEKAVAMNQQETNALANAGFQTPSYTLYVEP
jgi:type IV pilus assembly protein PilV